MSVSTQISRFMFCVKQLYLKNTDALHVSAIVLAIALVFWPVYQFNFVIGWDDQLFVTSHYTQNGFVWKNLKAMITEFYYGQYAPVNQLYYAALYTLFKYNPAYYHVTGLGLHAINAILVYFLVQTISQKLSSVSKFHAGQMGFFTAMLFAILPVNVEPVAWIAASKILLYALFYLMAIHSYCRYLQNSRSLFFYATVFLFIVSFGAKEQAVSLPFCLILIDFAYGRDLKSRMIWLEKLPFFVLMLFFCLVTIRSQGIDDDDRVFYTFVERVPLASFTLVEYFTKTIIPVNLSYLYPFPFLIGEAAPGWLWIYVVALPVLAYCFYPFLKNKWLVFGVLFFLIHIGLVVNLVSLARHSVIADRYTYIATIGPCLILAWVFINALKKSNHVMAIRFLGLLYVGGLMAYAHQHSYVWTDTSTLKQKIKYTIEKRDDFEELKKLK